MIRRSLRSGLKLVVGCATLAALGGAANWAIEFGDADYARAYLVALLILGGLCGAAAGILLEAALRIAGRLGIAPPPAGRRLRVYRRAAGVAWAIVTGLGIAALAAYLGSAPRFAGLLSEAPRNPEALESLPPNIILVSLDTVRPDRLGAYGDAAARTPVLDGLARAGVLFGRCEAASSWTVPSHAALFTGKSPSHVGVSLARRTREKPVVLPEKAVTLAEVLRSAGYQTAGFIGGATLGADFGFSQGFDEFNDRLPPSLSGTENEIFLGRAIRRLLNVPPEHLLRPFDPPFSALSNFLYDEAQHPASDVHVAVMKGAWRYENTADEVNQKVFAWLDRRPPRPFFLFVHYFDAHDPYDPPAPYAPPGYDPAEGYILKNGLVERVLSGGRPLDELERRSLLAAYDGEIAFMDHELGLLLRRLEAEGALENAVVAVSSDHGECFGEHGLVFHGHYLYEELTHAVLMLSGKNVPAGVQVPQLVSGIDVMPTLLDLAGVTGPGGMEGRSLRPLLSGGTLPERPAFSEVFSGKSVFPKMRAFEATRFTVELGGMKLHEDLHGAKRLFDLDKDPGELHDVLADHPDVAAQLGALLDEYLSEMKGPAVAPEEPPGKRDERALDKLKGIGYIR